MKKTRRIAPPRVLRTFDVAIMPVFCPTCQRRPKWSRRWGRAAADRSFRL